MSSESAHDRLSELAGAFGQFASVDACFEPVRYRRKFRRGFLLSPEEVATLWHPPTSEVRATRMSRNDISELEPPIALPGPSENDVTELGRVRFRQQKERFGLRLLSLIHI